MSRLWLCTFLALGGCLFVGDVNEPPTVELSVVDQTGTGVGVPLLFSATAYDDQPLPTLTVAVLDQDGKIPDACDFSLSNPNAPDANPQQFTVTFWQPGSYDVVVTPVDALGAVGRPQKKNVDVTAYAPMFSAPAAALAPAATGTACNGLYTSGAPIPIRLNTSIVDPEAGASQAAPMTDPQGSLCAAAPTLTLVWTLTDAPAGSAAVLGPATNEACPLTPPGNALTTLTTAANVDLVCLYVDANLSPTSPAVYGVALSASEGGEVATSDALMIPAIGIAPACLDGVYPVAGSYVLAGDEVTVFQAIGADELSNNVAGLEFLWTIEGPNDTSYTPLGVAATASEGGDRFSFDPTTLGYAVGDDVHLRVEVSDPTQTAPACAATDDVCLAASCIAAPATTCPRRATWDIEVR
jgi:hypothetical protein